MVRTHKVKVLTHSETSETALPKPRVSTGDQVDRRSFRLLTGFVVGQLVLSAIAITILGVYVRLHVSFV